MTQLPLRHTELYNAPIVSVVLCVHNGADFLAEAVQSILVQTMQEFELVIVDDGSTDGTGSFLAGVQDCRVRVIRNQVNIGLTRSLNVAMRESRGRYIARMDHDDVAVPSRLTTQSTFLDRNPDICIVGSWAEYIDIAGDAKGIWKTPTSPQSIARDMLRHNCFVHTSAMFRRGAMERVGGYDETLRYSQDYDLWLRMLDHGLGANIPECLVRYRVHPGQITSKKLIAQLRCAKRAVADTCLRRVVGAPPKEWDRLDSLIPNLRCHTGSAASYHMMVASLQERMGYRHAALKMLAKSQLMAPLSTKPGRRILAHFHRALLRRIGRYRCRLRKLMGLAP